MAIWPFTGIPLAIYGYGTDSYFSKNVKLNEDTDLVYFEVFWMLDVSIFFAWKHLE